TTAPVLTCAANKAVTCDATWTFDPPLAIDSCCGTNVTITIVSTTTNGVCPQVVTRTWRATDCCTNTAQCSQVVTVGRPTLNIEIKNGQLVLSWMGDGFALQEAESLQLPVQWHTLPTTPVVVNGTYFVTLPLTSGNRFYQLISMP